MPLGCVQENTRVLPRLSASDEWRAVTMVITLNIVRLRRPVASANSADCRPGTAVANKARVIRRAGGGEGSGANFVFSLSYLLRRHTVSALPVVVEIP